jgi:hypothetical protein
MNIAYSSSVYFRLTLVAESISFDFFLFRGLENAGSIYVTFTTNVTEQWHQNASYWDRNIHAERRTL